MYFLTACIVIFILFTDITLSNVKSGEFSTSCRHIYGLESYAIGNVINILVKDSIKIDTFKNMLEIDFKNIKKIQSYSHNFSKKKIFEDIISSDDSFFIEILYSDFEKRDDILILSGNEEKIKTLISNIIQMADLKNTDVIFFEIPYNFSYLYYFETMDQSYLFLPEFIAYKRLNENEKSMANIENSIDEKYRKKIIETVKNEKNSLKKVTNCIDNLYNIGNKSEILKKISLLEDLKDKKLLNENEFLMIKNDLLSKL